MKVISEWKKEIKCKCGSIIEVDAYDIMWDDEKYLCYFKCPVCLCKNYVSEKEIPQQIIEGSFHEHTNTLSYSLGRQRRKY